MFMKFLKLCTLSAIVLFIGCGGGTSSPTSSPAPAPAPTPTPTPTPTPSVPPSVGVFIDSPVAGISYRTESLSGVTNVSGEYEYLEGETVTFYIGELEFPAITATGVLTPEDLAASDSTTQTNILQVLQTLDTDANPDNGINISVEATSAFNSSNLDITNASFDTDVAASLTALSPGLTLVSEQSANQHFESTLKNQLIGSWLLVEGPGQRNILSFIDETRYIIIHEHSDADGAEGSQFAGSAEYGTYTWNLQTKEFSTELIAESDGWGGLHDDGSFAGLVEVNGDTLVLSDDAASEGSTLSRIVDDTNYLVGVWLLNEDSSDNFHLLTFLSASEYVLVHTNNQEAYNGETPQALSGEFGSYSIVDNEIHILGADVDTDGDGGLYNADRSPEQAAQTFRVTSWGDLEVAEENGDRFSLAYLTGFKARLRWTTIDTESSEDSLVLGDLGEVIVTRKEGFTEQELNDSHWQFSVSTRHLGQMIDDDYAVYLDVGGTGYIQYEGEEIITITWELNSAGTLLLFQENENDIRFAALAKIQGAEHAVIARISTPLNQSYTADVMVEATLSPSE